MRSNRPSAAVSAGFLIFQSALSHEKWLNPLTSSWCCKNISIHTLAREVTAPQGLAVKDKYISIHTLAREVTSRSMRSPLELIDFNPHPRTRSDLSKIIWIVKRLYFNPHPRTRSDWQGDIWTLHVDLFQSTPSHEKWRQPLMLLGTY